MTCSIRFFLLALLLSAAWLPGAPPDGSALFEKQLRALSQSGAPTIARRCRKLSSVYPNRAIVAALESGSMKVQGSKLSIAERQSIADFLSPPTESSIQPLKLNACPGTPPALANLNGWNGWSTDLINSRMQNSERSRHQCRRCFEA